MTDRQQLQAAIELIKSVLRLLSEHRVVVLGNRLQACENDSSESWDDVELAFENRIKTGIITNRRHVDLLKFMKDAKEEFIEKVRVILKEPLKVNKVDTNMEEFQERESGWSLKSILNLVVNI